MSGTVEKLASYGRFRLEMTGKLVQKSGFRIGAAESLSLYTDLPVLRWETGRDGRPYIPGSSLRGVMRAHLDRENGLLGFDEDKKVLHSLFGYARKGPQDNTLSSRGRLRVMDCVPTTVSIPHAEVRDHVSIGQDTGAARDKAKFDAEHVVKGQIQDFPFHLIYEGESKDDPELILLGEAVRALKDGELIIGSRASIGFGRFVLKDRRYRVFDRSTVDGLWEFLTFRLTPLPAPLGISFVFPPAKAPPVPGDPSLLPLHRLSYELSIPCNGPLLVKEAAKPKDVRSADEPNSAFLTTSNAQPVIPGASIRGVLRHRAEKICASQGLDPSPALRLFGSKKEQGVETERRGLVQFDDCVLASIPDGSPDAVSSDHLAVDRITHAAADGAKFYDRALNGPVLNVFIRAQFTDDEEDRVAIALLLFLIRDLMTDGSGIAFGSQTSRGYGSVNAASLVKIKGSVYGALAYSMRGGAGTATRLSLASLKLTPDDTFKQLCSALNKDWPPAKQVVPS